jgi:hypothetical protein
LKQSIIPKKNEIVIEEKDNIEDLIFQQEILDKLSNK